MLGFLYEGKDRKGVLKDETDEGVLTFQWKGVLHDPRSLGLVPSDSVATFTVVLGLQGE